MREGGLTLISRSTVTADTTTTAAGRADRRTRTGALAPSTTLTVVGVAMICATSTSRTFTEALEEITPGADSSTTADPSAVSGSRSAVTVTAWGTAQSS